jgi:hypothetical protein
LARDQSRHIAVVIKPRHRTLRAFMNQTATSLSVIALLETADIVVKATLLLLLFGSVWGWAVVVDK